MTRVTCVLGKLFVLYRSSGSHVPRVYHTDVSPPLTLTSKSFDWLFDWLLFFTFYSNLQKKLKLKYTHSDLNASSELEIVLKYLNKSLTSQYINKVYLTHVKQTTLLVPTSNFPLCQNQFWMVESKPFHSTKPFQPNFSKSLSSLPNHSFLRCILLPFATAALYFSLFSPCNSFINSL